MHDLPRNSLSDFLRRKARFLLWAGLAALGLRLFLVFCFPGIVDDSRLYANIAENWLQHGVYGVTNSGVIMPTLSRLPGYPAFLAAIFAIFGNENWRAVLLIQVAFDLGTCLLIADISRRLLSERAAMAAFLLAGLCPFLANYAATALTETLEIFFTALAFDLAVAGLATAGSSRRADPAIWLGCGLSIGAGILLRPDGGILLGVVGGYLLWLFVGSLRQPPSEQGRFSPRAIFLAGVLVGLGSIALLIPWTLRNLRTLHRFEPLAPRYATDSDEPVMTGFNRWVKTWMADYVSVQELYWPVPGEELDFTRLPGRAIDSTEQREQTRRLFADYNLDHDITPELDARFAALASDRIRSAPLRYYVRLPLIRIADMWFRPRTELFPSDPRWWEFNDDPRWLAVSLGFGVMNLAYVLMALISLKRSREIFCLALFVSFLVVRSLFLGTLENPEPRYTLECYPVVIFLASASFRSRA